MKKKQKLTVIPYCYEPLWNHWYIKDLLHSAKNGFLYSLFSDTKEEKLLLMLPLKPEYLQQIKFLTCQQQEKIFLLEAYTVFEDCILIRLRFSYLPDKLPFHFESSMFDLFQFFKETISLTCRLFQQYQYYPVFDISNIVFLQEGQPIFYYLPAFKDSKTNTNCLQTFYDFSFEICRRFYPEYTYLVYELYESCGIDEAHNLPYSAAYDFFILLLEKLTKLCVDEREFLLSLPITIPEYAEAKIIKRKLPIPQLVFFICFITLCFGVSKKLSLEKSVKKEEKFLISSSPFTTAPISTLHRTSYTTTSPTTSPTKTPIFYYDISNQKLSDISHLPNPSSLKELYANDNQICDIQYLKNASSLEVLLLQNNCLTDISCLKNLCNLKHIDLSNNYELSDISSLFSISTLEFLNVNATNVSNEQIQFLQQSNPSCKIINAKGKEMSK